LGEVLELKFVIVELLLFYRLFKMGVDSEIVARNINSGFSAQLIGRL